MIALFLIIVLVQACVSSKKAEPKAKNYTMFKTRKAESSYLRAYNNTLALWPIAYEAVNIKTSFGTAHIIISGPKNGDPLVLLHGMNASSTMWYPNIDALADKHRVYAIDFILEPGKSISNEKIKDKQKIIEWYNEIFNHLKLEQISIVGASRGGWLALHLAMDTTNRIKNIVLLSPAQSFNFIKLKRKMRSNVYFFLFPKRKRLRKSLQTFSSNADKIKALYIDQYYIASEKSKKNLSLLQMTPFPNEKLKSLKMPVLLLIGDKDIINDQKSIVKAQEFISNIETDIIQNSGHFLNMDQSEIVNKRILDFLKKNK
ncbi:MAG: alpha/beta hydrolase [Bacteroidetes bacterium]|nr:alpha/beta hydrolase [Bacteroidota bacterium]HET6245160.1 alpha/beta hydrolase [Bacteroidia bacterium]